MGWERLRDQREGERGGKRDGEREGGGDKEKG